MKGVWKGLVVGGLTGAGVGMLLDLLALGSRQATALGDKAVEMAPGAADHLKAAVAAGSARVEAAEIPDHLVEAVHHLRDSELTGQAKDAVLRAVKKGRTLVVDGHSS
jgi:hypothetical protein